MKAKLVTNWTNLIQTFIWNDNPISKGKEGNEVHGVAFMMDAESLKNLDRHESGGYNKALVTLKAYDGREL